MADLAKAESAEREAFAAIGALGEREMTAVKAWIASGCEGKQPRPDDDARSVLADQLKADAILVFTIRGNMARHAASFRPRYSPIYAICEFPGVADSLSLNCGVEPFVHPFNHEQPEQTVESALGWLVEQGRLRHGNNVVVITAISAGEQIVDVVEMRTVR